MLHKAGLLLRLQGARQILTHAGCLQLIRTRSFLSYFQRREFMISLSSQLMAVVLYCVEVGRYKREAARCEIARERGN